MGRVVSKTEIESELASVREKGGKIVFTNGCFDILHVGHVRYLKQAKSHGTHLFVGLNSDASVRTLKGPARPIQNQSDRSEIMAALECVDFICVFGEETPKELIHLVKPDVLVKGGDWKKEDIVGSEFVESYGGAVHSLSFHEGKSTTNIVEKAQSTD